MASSRRCPVAGGSNSDASVGRISTTLVLAPEALSQEAKLGGELRTPHGPPLRCKLKSEGVGHAVHSCAFVEGGPGPSHQRAVQLGSSSGQRHRRLEHTVLLDALPCQSPTDRFLAPDACSEKGHCCRALPAHPLAKVPKVPP